MNSNVLTSGNVSSGGPKYGGGPDPVTFGIVDSTQHDVTVTKSDNTIRIRGTNDISILWGLINIDTCTFDVTIDLTTLQPVP
ncbi:MAG: hypothetical protein A2X61_11480 [Ignavibacteria bacterium GWB2_35_12]|nr:MAG: hypothetical protein A2X61_11480 [Ignavibacteria bacterium GWB2_35_12]OGU86323.1 MAG: hypothetical protein A2220_15170 [Ignavibacteria bacterium RIFOXYA2_FULL_35_10]OGV20089.1 MAG: hypothetical protein A2475_05745 [Ignavibacteria bacterium RIFOXYC2_FULL_35_21]